MNELAIQLNETLKGTVAEALMSDVGRRMFFPKGIVAQSAEAKSLATRYNATIGMAVKDGQPMYLSDIYSQFVPGSFTPADIFSYAPGGGVKELRALWKEEMLEKNPDLQGKAISNPIVTSGLTHSISTICQLFAGKGDTLVLPDLAWDNYELMFSALNECEIKTFPMYDKDGRYNVEGLSKVVRSIPSKQARLILNFPNNPTGYTPSEKEMVSLAGALKELADDGYQLLVISDDAYYGLFYEKDTAKQSLFTKICDLSPNILAVKGDAATKEAMVWGFRIAFVTFGCKGFTGEQYEALEKKMMGIIRATVSNCDHPGQSLLVHAMKSKSYQEDKKKVLAEMRGRYETFHDALRQYDGKYDMLRPYPFNSGYFMAFATKGDAEELRKYLLEKYHVGCINIAGKVLRVAYCSVRKEDIPDLIHLLYQAAGELWN